MTPIPPWVFGLKRVWVMGYQGIMGYGVDFPLSRLGKAIILWVIRVYGLPEVWVKRVSTVHRLGRRSYLEGLVVYLLLSYSSCGSA